MKAAQSATDQDVEALWFQAVQTAAARLRQGLALTVETIAELQPMQHVETWVLPCTGDVDGLFVVYATEEDVWALSYQLLGDDGLGPSAQMAIPKACSDAAQEFVRSMAGAKSSTKLGQPVVVSGVQMQIHAEYEQHFACAVQVDDSRLVFYMGLGQKDDEDDTEEALPRVVYREEVPPSDLPPGTERPIYDGASIRTTAGLVADGEERKRRVIPLASEAPASELPEVDIVVSEPPAAPSHNDNAPAYERISIDALVPGEAPARNLIRPDGLVIHRAGYPLHESLIKLMKAIGIEELYEGESGPTLDVIRERHNTVTLWPKAIAGDRFELAEDVFNSSGTLLLPKGTRVTGLVKERLETAQVEKIRIHLGDRKRRKTVRYLNSCDRVLATAVKLQKSSNNEASPVEAFLMAWMETAENECKLEMVPGEPESSQGRTYAGDFIWMAPLQDKKGQRMIIVSFQRRTAEALGEILLAGRKVALTDTVISKLLGRMVDRALKAGAKRAQAQGLVANIGQPTNISGKDAMAELPGMWDIETVPFSSTEGWMRLGFQV